MYFWTEKNCSLSSLKTLLTKSILPIPSDLNLCTSKRNRAFVAHLFWFQFTFQFFFLWDSITCNSLIKTLPQYMLLPVQSPFHPLVKPLEICDKTFYLACIEKWLVSAEELKWGNSAWQSAFGWINLHILPILSKASMNSLAAASLWIANTIHNFSDSSWIYSWILIFWSTQLHLKKLGGQNRTQGLKNCSASHNREV